jgi:hypothetical protein
VTIDSSGRFAIASPVVGISCPPPRCRNVLSTQVDSGPLTIGSGEPKKQPTSVQLRLEPVCAAVRAQRRSFAPPTLNCVLLPGGVAPAGVVEAPPPM